MHLLKSNSPHPSAPVSRDSLRQPRLASAIRRTMHVSIVEGVYAQVHASIAWPGSVFLSKLLVMLGATPFQFGLLAAIGQFSQVFQPLGAVVTRKVTSRKGIVVTLSGIARVLVVFYGLVPLVLEPPLAIIAVLVVFLLSTTLQSVAGNAWIAWISDMIPREIRARFLARRAQILLAAGLATGVLLGSVIDAFEHGTGAITGVVKKIFASSSTFAPLNLPYCFAALFALSSVVGLIGLRILVTQPERQKPLERIGAAQLVAGPFRDRNFRMLLAYGCWWMLTVGIGSPFWQPFMITTLHMSLVDIQMYGLVSTLASLAVLRPWGVLIDRLGNKACMRIAIVLGGINPLVWVFVTSQHHGVLYLEAVTSGIMWAGAGLIAMNFVLSIAPEDRKQIYSGVYGACTGLAMMTTMLLSGALLPPGLEFGGRIFEPEQTLFALTGVLRWTTLIPLSWISEPLVRRREKTLLYLWQFAKVRVEWISDLLLRPRR
ncbi:MFS transporter [Candidatus Fermentibacteria bacterium]|nr:MFS transporter [Candidatus Fermentibacteria bacterium]